MSLFDVGKLLMVCLEVAMVLILTVSERSLASSGNLIWNPSFELDLNNDNTPDVWAFGANGGSRVELDRTAAHTGNASVHLHKVRDGRSTVAAVSQSVQVESDALYHISAWVALTEGSHATLYVYEFDAQNRYIGQNGHVGAYGCGTYKTFRPLGRTFRTSKNAVRVDVRFEIWDEYKTGKPVDAWVDDIYFGRATNPPLSPEDVRLEVYDDGVFLSWKPPREGQVSHYNVYRSEHPLTQPWWGALIATPSEPSYVDREARPGHRYYYYITASDEALNESEWPFPSKVALSPNGKTLPDFVVWTASGLQKIGKFSHPPASELWQSRHEVEISCARNEFESFQVAITSLRTPLRDVLVEITDLTPISPQNSFTLSREHIQICKVHSVFLPSVTPACRLCPGWIADALPPLTLSEESEALQVTEAGKPSLPYASRPILVAEELPVDETQALWFNIYVPPQQPAGVYRGIVRIRAKGMTPVDVEVKLLVYDFTLPSESHCGSAHGMGFYYIAQAHGVPVDSPQHQALKDRYYWFQVQRRLSPRHLPVYEASPEAAKYLDDPRVASFTIPGTYTKIAPNLAEVANFLRQRGWLGKGFAYVFDEPSPQDYPRCSELADQVHAAGEDIRVLLTEEPVKELTGKIDIWCPNISTLAMNGIDIEEDARAAHRRGEEYWWYNCGGPAGYPTYAIPEDAVSYRVLSWLQFLYRIDGVLYWDTVNWSWTASWVPLKRIYPDMEEWLPGEYSRVWERPLYGNGDGYLIYPGIKVGIDGPVASVRLEIIRDGNEDFEYLWLLRDLLKKQGYSEEEAHREVCDLINRIARSVTDFERAPEALLELRKEVAREIQALQRGTANQSTGS